MITFDVVREQHGWCVRTGQHMTTHFLSRKAAVREAQCLAAAIGRHGVRTEVIIEDDHTSEAGTNAEKRMQQRWALHG
jgi:hypothetical protein